MVFNQSISPPLLADGASPAGSPAWLCSSVVFDQFDPGHVAIVATNNFKTLTAPETAVSHSSEDSKAP
jgi:hypothetical protein